MTKDPDEFFLIGCGRCDLGGTPDCKVHLWSKELALLRQLILDTGLTENAKWGVPCYTLDGKNVIILAAYKDSCVLSFFKGCLIMDQQNLLEKIGENAQHGRIIRFTNTEKIVRHKDIITQMIFEAIEIEKSGVKLPSINAADLDLPSELKDALDNDVALNEAWYKLTSGRKKGYIFYFSAAKQSTTRVRRIEKYIPLILEGKGIHD